MVYQTAYDGFRTINGGLFARLRSHRMPHRELAICDSGLPVRDSGESVASDAHDAKMTEKYRIGALHLKIKFRGVP